MEGQEKNNLKVDDMEGPGEDKYAVNKELHDIQEHTNDDENFKLITSSDTYEGIAPIKTKEVATVVGEGLETVEGEDVSEVVYEGVDPKKKDPDVLEISSRNEDEDLDIASDNDDEDIVTVGDDTISDVDQDLQENGNSLSETGIAKKSGDMIIHFFKKATDANDVEAEVETSEQVQEGSKKRSVEDEHNGAGYNAAKYFNKKQKVVKIPIENDRNYCEVIDVEEPETREKYSHLGRYFDNSKETVEEEDEEEEDEDTNVPVCIDLDLEDEEETTSPKSNPQIGNNPELNKDTESSNSLINNAENDINVALDDSDEDEDPSEYLSDPAKKDLEQLNEFRSWEKTGLGNSMESGVRRLESGDVKLRILSYSVLSQAMLDSRPQLARGKSKVWLDWEYRWWGIMREILTLDPDVVLLQEIQMKNPNHFQIFFLPFFTRHGYESSFKCRTGDNIDGCAIFYKTDKFSLDKEVGVDFYRSQVDILSKINVGLIIKLIPLTGARNCSTRLVVSTAQFHHSQSRTDVRLAQAALLLAELDKHALKPNGLYHPTVMAGNFNLLPFSTVYQLITGGSLAYEGLVLGKKVMPRELVPEEVGLTGDCRWREALVKRGQSEVSTPGRLSHNFGLRSVYKHKKMKEAARPRTNKHPGEKEVSVFVDGEVPHMDKLLNVDYVFYNTVPSYYSGGQGDRVEGPLKLVARLTLPSEEEMVALGGMPSSICPSSHLPLAADFILKTF